MKSQRAVLPSLATRLFGARPEQRLALLRAVWPAAVGPELARRTDVIELNRGTLRVRVPDAAWRKVLHGLQRTLCAKLRDLVGPALAPARLSFQEAPLAWPTTEPAAPRPATPPPPPPPDTVRAGAAAIADPEIRERFLATAARALARGPHQPSKEP